MLAQCLVEHQKTTGTNTSKYMLSNFECGGPLLSARLQQGDTLCSGWNSSIGLNLFMAMSAHVVGHIFGVMINHDSLWRVHIMIMS
jgi:hypothetical protein